jgi:hypothetical protein
MALCLVECGVGGLDQGLPAALREVGDLLGGARGLIGPRFSNKRTRSIIGGTINSSAKIVMQRTLTAGLCAVM